MSKPIAPPKALAKASGEEKQRRKELHSAEYFRRYLKMSAPGSEKSRHHALAINRQAEGYKPGISVQGSHIRDKIAGKLATPVIPLKDAARSKLAHYRQAPAVDLGKEETNPTNGQPKSAASPKIALRNWDYKPDNARNMIHFTHKDHGHITVRPNDKASSSKEFPFVAVHNGASIGRYKSPADAALGVTNYIRSLPKTPTTRQYNVNPTTLKQEMGSGNTPHGDTSPQIDPKSAAQIQAGVMETPSQKLNYYKQNLMAILGMGKSETYFRYRLEQLQKAAPKAPKETPAPAAEAPKEAKVKSPSYHYMTAQEASPKSAKNEGRGFLTAMLYLPHHSHSGENWCPHASPGCISTCLGSSGQGGQFLSEPKEGQAISEQKGARVPAARMRRAMDLIHRTNEFGQGIKADMEMLKFAAARQDLMPNARMNATTDFPWHKRKFKALGDKTVYEAFPEVQFHEYTKDKDRILNNNNPNVHYTFSRSEKNHADAMEVLKHGHNVAMVFGGKELPKTYMGHPVISGDEHDLRFLDPKAEKGSKGYIIGLKAKGDAARDNSGFVVWDHEGNPDQKAKPKPKQGSKMPLLSRLYRELRAKHKP